MLEKKKKEAPKQRYVTELSRKFEQKKKKGSAMQQELHAQRMFHSLAPRLGFEPGYNASRACMYKNYLNYMYNKIY